MAATSAAADPASRVPAWKRIGLKLKYARDTPTEAQSQSTITSAPTPSIHPERQAFHKPEKRNLEYQQPGVSVKRARVEPAKPVSAPKAKPTPGSAPKTRTAGQQVWHEEERSSLPAPSGVFKAPGQTAKRIVFGEDDEDSSQILAIATSSPRPARSNSLRKSVSFTPDTKKEDTFSAQTLIADWEAAEDAAEALAKDSTIQPTSPSKPSKPAKPAKEPKAKKEKQKKTKSTSNSKTDEGIESKSKETPNFVKYLEQFSNDKANWKFNKNRQNDLFKHLFDVDLISSKYNPALVQYVASTQGLARQRIAEHAEEALKLIWAREHPDEDMPLDTPEARRAAYYEAMHTSIERYKQSGAGRTQYGDRQLKEILREHEQGQRAEELLRKALEDEIFADQSSTPATTVSSTPNAVTMPAPISKGIPGATRIIETTNPARGEVITKEINLTMKRKRTRKSRTDVSFSSESSSDDNSDDSSSGESDAPPAKKQQQQQQQQALPSNKKSGPLFDAEVLDKKFGKPRTYNEVAAKRKGADKGQPRGFDYRHGTRADESDSE